MTISPTREEIEARLLARIQACRVKYEEVRDSYRDLRSVSRDLPATLDGAVAGRQVSCASAEFRAAIGAYQCALKDLTEFVVNGRIPLWMRDGAPQ